MDPSIITQFKTNSEGTHATAVLKSMFKFPEGSEVHLQCDIVQCNGGCKDEDICNEIGLAGFVKGGRALGQNEDGMMLAATTVFVLDPSEAPCKTLK